MRLALPACKFEGLQLGHQFFNDLMSLLEALGLNGNKDEVKKSCEKHLESLCAKEPPKALQIPFPTNGGPDLVKGNLH